MDPWRQHGGEAGYQRLRWLCVTRSGSHPRPEVLDDGLEHAGIEFVDNLLTDASRGDEISVTKHAEMARHGGPLGVEVLGDFPGCQWAVAQKPQDIPSRGVGECSKGGVHACIVS